MKNKTYTVKFFKDLINQGSPIVKVEKDLQDEDDQRNHDLENFFSALFAPPIN
jgi:hypothetical protein